MKHGCLLSPGMLNYVTDWTMKNTMTSYPGIELSPSLYISDLEIVNDVVVFGGSTATMQSIPDRDNPYSAKVNFETNTTKTKGFSIFLNEKRIKHLPSFKYLGSYLTPNRQGKDEDVTRIDNIHRAIFPASTNVLGKQ